MKFPFGVIIELLCKLQLFLLQILPDIIFLKFCLWLFCFPGFYYTYYLKIMFIEEFIGSPGLVGSLGLIYLISWLILTAVTQVKFNA